MVLDSGERIMDNKTVRHLSCLSSLSLFLSLSLSLSYYYYFYSPINNNSCPICRIEGRCDSQSGEFDKNHWDGTHMLDPEGSRSYRTADGSTKRCTVRGFIFCRQCHTQWSRDFCAAINIGYAFAFALSSGRCVSVRDTYVRPTVRTVYCT